MTSVRGTAIGTRAARAFLPLAAMIAIVTVAMAVLATALPRAVDGFLTAGVRYDTAQAAPLERDVTALGKGEFTAAPAAPGTDVGDMDPGAASSWGLLDEQVTALHDSLADPLRSALGKPQLTATTFPETVLADAKPTASVGIAFDPRLLSRLDIVTGTAPTFSGSNTVVEVMASTAVAKELDWSVGETRTMFLADRLTQDVLLTAIWEAKNPQDDYWSHTTSAVQPSVDSRDLPPDITATVFANAAGYPGALSSVASVRSSVWFPVSAQAPTATSTADLAQQVRRFTSVNQRIGADKSTVLSFRSGLATVLDAASARNSSSQAILATILAGPLGVALAIEILVARLAATRLRDSLTLIEARGTSRLQRRLLLGLPALAIGIVATAIGIAIALLMPGGSLGTVGVVAIAVTAVAPAVLLAALGSGERRSEGAASGPTRARWRLAVEGLVLVATASALLVLFQRGLAASGSVDVLAAAAPLLLSLVGCVVALRVYPLALRRVVARAHRARGFSGFYGTTQALRGGSAGLVPILTVLIGVSVAVFSGVLSATLATGLDSASRTAVGADVSITGARLDEAAVARIRALDGVAQVATVSTLPGRYLIYEGGNPITVTVMLVDLDDFRGVQKDIPGAFELSNALRTPDGDVVRVAASQSVVTAMHRETTGKLNHIDIALVPPTLASDIFRTFPNWVITDRANGEALGATESNVADQVLLRVDATADPARIAAALRPIVGDAPTIETPQQFAAALDANPAVGGIRAAVLFAIIGSGILSSAALILTTVLDARARRRTLDLLATLGLSRRQARSAVLWELAPLSIVGLLVGVLLGAVLSAVVLSTIDLRPFTAGIVQPGPAIDPWLSAITLGGFVVVLAATALVAAARATRAAPTSTTAAEGWNS